MSQKKSSAVNKARPRPMNKVKPQDEALDFLKDEDVKSTNASLESAGPTLKIEKGRTPVFLVTSKFGSGYVHWVKGSSGKGDFRVVCGGGKEGKGYATDSCKICKWMSGVYDKAGQLQSSAPKKAQAIRDTANKVHAKFEVLFVAAKGELLTVKDKRTGKKKESADFDEAQVGLLPMTKKQWQDFQGLVDGEKYPFMVSKKDLFNRAIIIDKRNRNEDRYPTIEFIPSNKQQDCPVEFDLSDFDLVTPFEIQQETIALAAGMLASGGKKPGDDAKYDDEEALDEYLADDDDDADAVSGDDADDDGDAAVADDDDEFDDSFLDDDEEEDEVPAKKKQQAPQQKLNHGKKRPREATDF